MRVLIALAEPLPPQASGGSQKVALEVASLLAEAGDAVALAGRFSPKQRSGWGPAIRAVRTGRLFHREPGPFDRFRFFRGGKGFAQVLDSFSPDVVLLHTMSAMPLAAIASARRLPLVLYWHDVEFHKLGGHPPQCAVHVANSGFTAGRLEQRFGLNATVVPPLFSHLPNRRRLGAHDRLLFINPVADKGLDQVIAIARALPELTVEMVESWVMGRNERHALRTRLADLPNVILTPRQSTMAPVYERAWLLLAPSRWEEAWGRVVSEAQSYGVPVLASRIGGLPEAVGPGGLLFSPNAGPDAWIAGIQGLREDSHAYDDLVRATHAAACRPQVDPERNISLLRAAIDRAMAGSLDHAA